MSLPPNSHTPRPRHSAGPPYRVRRAYAYGSLQIPGTIVQKIDRREDTVLVTEVVPDSLRFEGEEPRAYWVKFSILLSIAVIVATAGLFRNSAGVVIAAMLIAPLMTPILGIASAMVMGLAGRAVSLLLAVAIASLGNVALAFFLLYVADAPLGMTFPAEVLARTDPGLEEMMIALAAGIAGAYVQMRKEEASLLPGVAIGVSLVPPLSASGMLLYFGQPALAWEAALLFVTNLVAIVLSACGVFFALGMRPAKPDKAYLRRFGLGALVTFTAIAVLAIELGYVTLERFREARDEERVVAAINLWTRGHPVEITRIDVKRKGEKTLVDAALIVDVPGHLHEKVLAPAEMVPSWLRREALLHAIEEVLGPKTEFSVRFQPRFSSRWDVESRTRLGLPSTVNR